MNAVEVFQFPATGQRLRTLLRDGEPWFVLNDVGEVLELANPHSSAALLDDDERGIHTVETRAGDVPVAVISEAGLYSLILRSRKPEARAFKRWVTHEVLPAIRRTGSYSAPAHRLPQTYAEALRELAASVERRDQIERELEAAAPKAEAWDVLASAHGDYSVREAAFILNRDPAIDTGHALLCLADLFPSMLPVREPARLGASVVPPPPATFELPLKPCCGLVLGEVCSCAQDQAEVEDVFRSPLRIGWSR